jgi:hypothetical protein
MHRRASTLLALFAAGALLASCSGDGTADPAAGGGETAATVAPAGSTDGGAEGPVPRPDGDPARPLEVALLRAAGDGPSLAQSATDGLRAAVAEDGHVELAEITGATAEEVPAVLQKLCDDRYDLVIGVGADLVEPVVATAAACPTTAFLANGATAAGHAPTANLADWTPGPVDVGYPLGVLAGRALAPGAAVALAGPADAASAAVVASFERGLADTNPTATAGPLGAAGAALVFCPTGCDAAAAAAGLPMLSGLGAPAAPVALAATPLALSPLYRDAFHLVRQQRLGGITFTSTIDNGQVEVRVDATATGTAVPASDLARIAADLVEQVRSGAVKLPSTAV